MEALNNKLCNKHDGFKERFSAIEDRVTKLEESMRRLWQRLDKFMFMAILILGALIANLAVSLWK